MHGLEKYDWLPHRYLIGAPLPYDAHSCSSSPTQVRAPGAHVSSTQTVPLQCWLGAQSTSVAQAMLLQIAPPPGVASQISVAEQLRSAQVLFTQVPCPSIGAQC